MFFPDAVIKIWFDMLLLVLIVLNILYIPLKLSFEVESFQNVSTNIMLDTLPSIVFIIEIFMNFNTAYYS